MAKIGIKSAWALARMREAGKLAAGALQLITREAKPSVTTGALDRMVEEFFLARNARPAFKGYKGYPATICTSLNEQVVHGIPGKRKLKEGDLLSVDVGVFLDGYAADTALTLEIGTCSAEARKLTRVTRQALRSALAVVRPGVRISEISGAVQRVVESNGFSVVREYTGHGIGRELHEEPQVPNYVSSSLQANDPILPEGATIAIEPMVNAGTHHTRVLADGWTVVTKDGRPSAHFEHTVAVTADGAEVLTAPDEL